MFLSSIGAPEQSRPAALSWHRGYAVGDHMGDTLKLLHPWWRWWYMMINHGIFWGPQLQTKVCHSLTVFSNLPKIENHAAHGKETPDFFTALFWVAYVVGPCLRFGGGRCAGWTFDHAPLFAINMYERYIGKWLVPTCMYVVLTCMPILNHCWPNVISYKSHVWCPDLHIPNDHICMLFSIVYVTHDTV